MNDFGVRARLAQLPDAHDDERSGAYLVVADSNSARPAARSRPKACGETHLALILVVDSRGEVQRPVLQAVEQGE